ncbi:piggyBac transposable element-derived protein 4-like [Argopecten irradians]|uniref:piggyBac transposable element-derived protein 4-like n=1 Tax=Argopecten irradians TaxID=31199 RepID=UPI003717560D
MLATHNAKGVDVNIPAVNDLYNKKMGGVDLSDKSVQAYDPDARTCKLWKRILINLLLKMMNNAYIVYRQRRGLRQKMHRLEFYQSVYQSLVGEYRQERRRPGPRSALDRLTDRHFVDMIDGSKRKICQVCDRRIRTWCAVCEAGLCVGDCFRRYHTQRDFRRPQQEE